MNSRFKKKWGTLNLVARRPIAKAPFPGRNPVRWAIVVTAAPSRAKLLYEGKPSIQALERIRIAGKVQGDITLLEFDRKGTFFIQNFERGKLVRFAYVGIPEVWNLYHAEVDFSGVMEKLKRRDCHRIPR